MHILQKAALSPVAFVDTDPVKIGKTIEGIPVISLNDYLENRDRGNEQIIVAFSDTNRIAAELVANGVLIDQIIIAHMGEHLMNLGDCSGCVPLYHSREKYGQWILREIARLNSGEN